MGTGTGTGTGRGCSATGLGFKRGLKMRRSKGGGAGLDGRRNGRGRCEDSVCSSFV